MILYHPNTWRLQGKSAYGILCFMIVNVEVSKNNNENAVNLIRRFTKRVQGSGVLKRVRSIRYSQRPLSKFTQKKKALKKMTRVKEITRLKKLGRM